MKSYCTDVLTSLSKGQKALQINLIAVARPINKKSQKWIRYNEAKRALRRGHSEAECHYECYHWWAEIDQQSICSCEVRVKSFGQIP